MSAHHRALLLAAYGVVLVRLAASDRLLAYVRPATRPYLLAAGTALAVLGACCWLRSASQRHSEPLRVGWLLLAPLAVLVLVPPPPDGALAGVPRRSAPSRPGNPVGPLRGVDPVAVRVSDVVVRAAWAPETLRHRQLRIIGFVAGARPGGFTLARLSITCCAADAQQDDIDVTGSTYHPRPRQWVAVTGRFSGTSRSDRYVPAVHAQTVAPIPAPADPYD